MKNLTALLLLLPVFASADPGPATKYLMNDPASMLDIGILKAEKNLNGILDTIKSNYTTLGKDNLLELNGFVEYSYEDDLIVFSATLRALEPDAENLEKECRDILSTMRIVTRVHMGFWFAHEGFSRTNVPDKLVEQIGSRIELRCNGASVYLSADPLNPIVSVRSKLMDDKVFVTKKGDEK